MNQPAEQELLHRLAQGDEAALAAIYQQHWQGLFLSAYGVLKDRKQCEDIIQDIFLQLWLRRAELQVRETLKAYLSTAVRYQVFRHLRKAAEQRQAQLRLPAEPAAQEAEQALFQKDIRQRIEAVVAVLPHKCRQIYRMSREDFLSHKEIAAQLQISPKTVENQLTIALRRLRHSLDGFWVWVLLFAAF